MKYKKYQMSIFGIYTKVFRNFFVKNYANGFLNGNG